MALGVEAAGIAAAVSAAVGRFAVGDRVTAHSAPLREQGGWAEWFIVPGEHCAIRDGAHGAAIVLGTGPHDGGPR